MSALSPGWWVATSVAAPLSAAFRTTAAASILFNAAAGTNYGYLNRKPDTASLLDLLPGWPAYVVLEIAVVAVVWALMTWPFTLSGPQPSRATVSPCEGT